MRSPVKDPLELVRDFSRSYIYKGKYPQIVVYTHYTSETDILLREFGGHIYNHRSGFVWILSKQALVAALYSKLKSSLPRDHPIHDLFN